MNASSPYAFSLAEIFSAVFELRSLSCEISSQLPRTKGEVILLPNPVGFLLPLSGLTSLRFSDISRSSLGRVLRVVVPEFPKFFEGDEFVGKAQSITTASDEYGVFP